MIVAVLTILSPLAFAMSGSKSTSDIFKGWVRMFASMCLMVVLSVLFLKFILSAMSVVPKGVAIIPWTVFIVALARMGRKIDSIVTKIGLNPAITGDPLGHSRMPGMLSYMVIRNMAGSIGKAAAANGARPHQERAEPQDQFQSLARQVMVSRTMARRTQVRAPRLSGRLLAPTEQNLITLVLVLIHPSAQPKTRFPRLLRQVALIKAAIILLP